MSVSYELVYPEVLPYVPNCPDLVAFNAIRNAVIEFCDLTLAWQEDTDPTPLIAGLADYELDLPTGADVADVAFAAIGLRQIFPRTADNLVTLYGRDWRQYKGSPLYFNKLSQNNVLTLVPIPDDTYATTKESLRARVIYKPSRASKTFPDYIYNAYLETLAAGAKARLFMMVGQSFFNPDAAAANRAMFNAGVRDARISANKANVRSDVRVSFRKDY